MGDLPQSFETVVYVGGEPSALVISIPRYHFAYPGEWPSPEEAAAALGLSLQSPVAAGDVEAVLSSIAPEAVNKLFYDVQIPVQESPLAGKTINSLIASRGADAAGVMVGYLAVGGPSLWLFLSVPAGIVLVRAARGVGAGLEKGLRRRIGRFLSGRGASSKRLGR